MSVPASEAAHPAAVDPDVLDLEPMLRNFGGISPMVTDLYALFLRNEEDLHRTIRSKLRDGDLAGARLAAHAAGGAARTAGARQLAALCSTIEEALVRGDAPAAARGSQALSGALAAVRAMVARI
ncbi:MAG TPA: Hpt domain-containing protein [Azospirillum sp.]|nr:Hpt domain-containing protein [Azospirillum sp.]